MRSAAQPLICEREGNRVRAPRQRKGQRRLMMRRVAHADAVMPRVRQAKMQRVDLGCQPLMDADMPGLSHDISCRASKMRVLRHEGVDVDVEVQKRSRRDARDERSCRRRARCQRCCRADAMPRRCKDVARKTCRCSECLRARYRPQQSERDATQRYVTAADA